MIKFAVAPLNDCSIAPAKFVLVPVKSNTQTHEIKRLANLKFLLLLHKLSYTFHSDIITIRNGWSYKKSDLNDFWTSGSTSGMEAGEKNQFSRIYVSI